MEMRELIGIVESAESVDEADIDALKAEIEQQIIKGNGFAHNRELRRAVSDTLNRFFIDPGKEFAWSGNPDSAGDTFIDLSDPDTYGDDSAPEGYWVQRTRTQDSSLRRTLMKHARKFRNQFLKSGVHKVSLKITLIQQITDKSNLSGEELSILSAYKLKTLAAMDDPSEMARAFDRMIDELDADQNW